MKAMRLKTPHIDEILDACLDGELPRRQRRMVTRHLKDCESCRKKWQEQRDLSLQLRTLPMQSCPEHVVERVMQKTQPADQAEKWWLRFGIIKSPVLNWRLATGFAMATAVALFLVLWPTGREKSSPQHQYSPEEVAQAKLDVERALGYLAEVIERTQKIIEQEVVPEQVVKPLKKGLHAAFGSLQNNGG